MKFTIKYDELYPILKDLCDIAAPKEGDTGKSLLIGTDEDRVLFSTTGNGIIAYSYIEADVEKEGEIIVEAKLLFDLMKKLSKKNDLTFAVKGGARSKYLEVVSAKGEYQFDPIKVEFPIPKSKFHWNYTLNADRLLDMFNKAGWLFGTKLEDYESAEGVLLEFTGTEFNVISSDMVKFACCTYVLPENKQVTPASVIVPNKIVKVLMNHLKKAEGEATIHIADEHAKFTTKNVNYICEIISSDYPDIRSRINKDEKANSILIERLELSRVLSRLILFVDKVREMVTLDLKKNKMIKFSSHNIGNKKSSTEQIDTSWPYVSIYKGVNGQKFYEIVRKMKSDDVRLLIRSGEHSPVEIQEPGNIDVYYLLSSLRID